jgi:general secretion pathway protein G
MRKSTIRKAFTLVEILIVVVILGILAAIVVPQFTSATQDSQAGNIKSQLGTLQRQIELYQAKNNAYPTWAGATHNGWDLLVTGGYIKEAPSNPAGTGSATYTTSARKTITGAASGTGVANQGWLFNTTDNKVYASYFDEVNGVVTNATP